MLTPLLVCMLCVSYNHNYTVYYIGELLLAVGSEDCTIALVAASPHSRPSVLTTLTGHLSSVKALTSSQGHYGQLLFSGGARASLKAWSIPSSKHLR